MAVHPPTIRALSGRGSKYARELRETAEAEGVARVQVSTLPTRETTVAPRRRPIYGIHRATERDEWDIRGLTFSTFHVVPAAADTEYVGHHLAHPPGHEDFPAPSDGVHLDAAPTKREALDRIGADASTLVEAGAYYVTARHDPSEWIGEADRDAVNQYAARYTEPVDDLTADPRGWS
jgi:hypothetical protein